MKKLLFFLFSSILWLTSSIAQRVPLTTTQLRTMESDYLAEFKRLNADYKCATGDPKTNYYVNPVALDSSFRSIFSTVILNNDELITNGTAGSLTQDKDKSVLSFNYAFINKNLTNAFNFGLYGSSSGTVFNFYSSKSWQKGVGLNLGWTNLSSTNTRTFESDHCEKLVTKRNMFITARLGTIYEIINQDVNALENDSVRLWTSLNIANKSTNGDIIPSEKSYKDDLEEYEKVCLKLKRYDSLISTITPAVLDKSIVKKEIVEFDKANAEFTGYKVKWFSLNGTIGFGSNKIYNDTLKTNDSLLNFYNKDFLRGKLTAAYSWTSYQKKYLWFFTLSCGAYNTNFLENRNIADIPILRYDTPLKKIVIQNNESKNLGTLEEFKNTVWAINPGAYFSMFLGKKKIFGYEINANYTAYFDKPKDVKMPNTFNSTVGLLIRLVLKDPAPKATIGLVFGLFDAQEDTQVWRNTFGTQLKIGVPFNVLFSKKDKE